MSRRGWIWISALAAALAFDILFWKQRPGISFFLFTAVCLAAGIIAVAINGFRPDWQSALLIPVILAAAAVSFLRVEALTVVSAVLLTMGLLVLLAISYRGGKWPQYGVIDAVTRVVQLGVNMLLHPALIPNPVPTSAEGTAGPAAWRRWLFPVLRGLLLALPVFLFFALLLTSADRMFADIFGRIFDLNLLPEYLFRLFYIILGMYFLTGVFLHALHRSADEDINPAAPPAIKPFIGFIEAAVVLAVVDLLFLGFVLVQFRYFFGGGANITAQGFTYAEYARQGFGELVAVAFFSLLLLLGLSALARREDMNRQRIFSALGTCLVALVVVILISSWQRLSLYEDAYGLSQLRFYTHAFIPWLGLLLLVTAALEAVGRIRYFTVAALAAACGFTFTLAIAGVDGSIVRWNAAKAAAGAPLDAKYLNTLGPDAVPALLDLYQASAGEEKYILGAGLSCRYDEMQDLPASWQSFNLSEQVAIRLISESGIPTLFPMEEDSRSLMDGTICGELRSDLVD